MSQPTHVDSPRPNTLGAVADGLARMGLGKSPEAEAVRAKERARRAQEASVHG